MRGREWLALGFGKWARVHRVAKGCSGRVDRLRFSVCWAGVSFWVKRWFGPRAWVLSVGVGDSGFYRNGPKNIR